MGNLWVPSLIERPHKKTFNGANILFFYVGTDYMYDCTYGTMIQNVLFFFFQIYVRWVLCARLRVCVCFSDCNNIVSSYPHVPYNTYIVCTHTISIRSQYINSIISCRHYDMTYAAGESTNETYGLLLGHLPGFIFALCINTYYLRMRAHTLDYDNTKCVYEFICELIIRRRFNTLILVSHSMKGEKKCTTLSQVSIIVKWRKQSRKVSLWVGAVSLQPMYGLSIMVESIQTKTAFGDVENSNDKFLKWILPILSIVIMQIRTFEYVGL